MKFFIIISLVTVVLATELEEWTKFKLENKKSYKDVEEESHRFSIFKKNLKEIVEHNNNYMKGLTTYTKRINKYADLTPVEFENLYTLRTTKTVTYNDSINTIECADNKSSNNEHFDWREKGAVTPVKDQRNCGSCWIFSSIGILEGYYFRKYNKLISFSAQHMVDCISSRTCSGGVPISVIYYVERYGISTEDDYPYEAKHNECRRHEMKTVNITFNNIVIHVSKNETVLKATLADEGPISVSLYVDRRWMFYDSGIWYEKECSELVNHSMLLVGYGRENGQDYWLLKNSLGKDWGDEGYIKFARNRHYNYCGIMSMVFYVN